MATPDEVMKAFDRLSPMQKETAMAAVKSILHREVTINHNQAKKFCADFEGWFLEALHEHKIKATSETIEHISQNLYYVMVADTYRDDPQHPPALNRGE